MTLRIGGVVVLLAALSSCKAKTESGTAAQAPGAVVEASASAGEKSDPRLQCPHGSKQESTATSSKCVDERGLPHGPFVSRNEKGQKLEEAYYVHGRYEGVRQRWHENGVLEAEENYRGGLRHGVGRSWHENGKLASQSRWACDEVVGTERRWDDAGRVTEEKQHPETVPGCSMGDEPSTESPAHE